MRNNTTTTVPKNTKRKMNHFARNILNATLVCLLATTANAEVLGPASGTEASGIDLEPPVIMHDPIVGSLKANQPLELQVRITDNHGVFSATLFYRDAGAKEYRSLAMRLSETDDNVFVIEIPGQDIHPPKLEYYIQATDVSGNTVLRGGRLFPLSANVEGGFVPLAPTVAGTTADDGSMDKGLKLKNDNKEKYMWAWIAGGALVGALYAASNKDGDTPPSKPGTLTVVIPNPQPTN